MAPAMCLGSIVDIVVPSFSFDCSVRTTTEFCFFVHCFHREYYISPKRTLFCVFQNDTIIWTKVFMEVSSVQSSWQRIWWFYIKRIIFGCLNVPGPKKVWQRNANDASANGTVTLAHFKDFIWARFFRIYTWTKVVNLPYFWNCLWPKLAGP